LVVNSLDYAYSPWTQNSGAVDASQIVGYATEDVNTGDTVAIQLAFDEPKGNIFFTSTPKFGNYFKQLAEETKAFVERQKFVPKTTWYGESPLERLKPYALRLGFIDEEAQLKGPDNVLYWGKEGVGTLPTELGGAMDLAANSMQSIQTLNILDDVLTKEIPVPKLQIRLPDDGPDSDWEEYEDEEEDNPLIEAPEEEYGNLTGMRGTARIHGLDYEFSIKDFNIQKDFNGGCPNTTLTITGIC
jgi:hypothetical protein